MIYYKISNYLEQELLYAKEMDVEVYEETGYVPKGAHPQRHLRKRMRQFASAMVPDTNIGRIRAVGMGSTTFVAELLFNYHHGDVVLHYNVVIVGETNRSFYKITITFSDITFS